MHYQAASVTEYIDNPYDWFSASDWTIRSSLRRYTIRYSKHYVSDAQKLTD